MLLLASIWTVGRVLLMLLGVLRMTIWSVLTLVTSVLVPILTAVHTLVRGRVAPLVPGYHGVAILVVLRILRLLEHRTGTAPVHGWRAKVDWLRLAPGPALGDRGLLGRQLVGGGVRDVERLGVHGVDWDLRLCWR